MLLCCFVNTACAQAPVLFAGTTPCREGSQPLPGMPQDKPCEMMKWKLSLSPHTFTLHCTYGMGRQGSKEFADGGATLDLHGEWVTEGTALPIYRLTDAASGRTISFRKLNEDVLHLLDSGGRLMIGSAAWSYTLNRIK